MLSEGTDKYPNCYEDHVLEACAGDAYDGLKSCAANSTSATWMQESAKTANAVNGGHPSWVFVDGVDVTDDSKGTDAWAASVLAAMLRAPLTASMLLFELTRDYDVVLPLVASAGVAALVVELLGPKPERGERRDAGE